MSWNRKRCAKCIRLLHAGIEMCRYCTTGVWPGWEMTTDRKGCGPGDVNVEFHEWTEDAGGATLRRVGWWRMNAEGKELLDMEKLVRFQKWLKEHWTKGQERVSLGQIYAAIGVPATGHRDSLFRLRTSAFST